MTVTRRDIANAFLTLSFMRLITRLDRKGSVIMKMITYAVLRQRNT